MGSPLFYIIVGVAALVLTICYLAYGFYRNRLDKPVFDTEGIVLGGNKILWSNISSISTVNFPPFGGLTAIFVCFEFLTPSGVYRTKPIWNRSKLVNAITEADIFDVVQRDWFGYPVRWAKKGTDYKRTSVNDWLMESNYLAVNMRPPENKLLAYLLIGVFFTGMLIMLVLVLIQYQVVGL